MRRVQRYALIATLIGAAIALGAGRSVLAQQGDSELLKRIAALEAGQNAILKELQALKVLLQQPRPPLPVPTAAPGPVPGAPANTVKPSPAAALPSFDLELAGSPSKGRADAKLVLVEFSDFECPFCGRYVRDTYEQIVKEYIDSGKLRYVFRHYPIEQLHPRALRASEGAECARAQGKFWEYHTKLFTNQQALGEPDLTAYAQVLKLDMPAFQQCLSAQLAAPTKIRQDQAEGSRAGITGTPTFFIGTVTKDGKLKVLRKMVGAHPITSFRTTLDMMLAESK